MAMVVMPVDGVAYSADVLDDLFEALAHQGNAAYSAVVRDLDDELEVTGTSSPVSVAAGWMFVKGKLIKNTAAESVNVPTPATNPRIDRIVVEIDFTTTPVSASIKRVAGTETVSPTAPALTQTDGTTWQVSLAQARITTGGVVTIADERRYLGYGTVDEGALLASVAGNGLTGGAGSALAVNVDDSTIEINADALRLKARTATFFVPASAIMNVTDNLPLGADSFTAHRGWYLDDAKLWTAYGNFLVPSDFVSGMTVRPVVFTGSAGTIYAYHEAYGGAIGEFVASIVAVAYTTVVLTGNLALNYGGASASLSGIASGDYVYLGWARDGTHLSDTLDSWMYFVGWLVSYTRR